MGQIQLKLWPPQDWDMKHQDLFHEKVKSELSNPNYRRTQLNADEAYNEISVNIWQPLTRCVDKKELDPILLGESLGRTLVLLELLNDYYVLARRHTVAIEFINTNFPAQAKKLEELGLSFIYFKETIAIKVKELTKKKENINIKQLGAAFINAFGD